MTDAVYLRDLDGTGSMHVCSQEDPGAREYLPSDARPMTVAEAAKVIIAEIYRPATNEERPDWRYLSRLDLPSLRALSQGGE